MLCQGEFSPQFPVCERTENKGKILKALLKEGTTGLLNGLLLGGLSFGLFLLFFYVTKTEIHIVDGYKRADVLRIYGPIVFFCKRGLRVFLGLGQGHTEVRTELGSRPQLNTLLTLVCGSFQAKMTLWRCILCA